MRFMFTLSVLMMILITPVCWAAQDNHVPQLLEKYLQDHQKDELISGIVASISAPHEKIQTYVAGTVSKDNNADPMIKNNMFQIGSITKSYTAAIILLLEQEGKLNINQTVGEWLPKYTKWKKVTIKQLLNMTSGIPGYLSSPKLEAIFTKDIKKQWSDKEIVDIVYENAGTTKAYNYSDTNYLILGMIIEEVARNTYTGEINKRLINKYHLNQTLYYVEPYSKSLLDIQPRGYYYGKSTGSIKYGDDVTDTNLSVGGPAGAILATTEDVIHWVRLLFSGAVLAEKQQKELQDVISMKTGKPIKSATADDRFGFGLGVVQGYNPELGKYWYYEGDTIGHRAIYMWVPCNDIIISIALNSSPFVDENVKDHAGDLLMEIYHAVAASDKKHACVAK